MDDLDFERNAAQLVDSLFGVKQPAKLTNAMELAGITNIRMSIANSDWLECPGAKLVRLEPKNEDMSILGFESHYKLMTILNILLKKVTVFDTPSAWHFVGGGTFTIVSVRYDGPAVEVA